ncbi:MAG: amidase [Polyangiaceae bacterium]
MAADRDRAEPAARIGYGPEPWPDLEHALHRLALHDDKLGAVCLRLDDAARRERTRGRTRAPLAGVPFGLKDVWDARDSFTTAGNLRHVRRRAGSDSLILRALRDAGAVCVGRTNVSDLAATPECANLLYGVTRNPHDLTRTSGGSSGGAAAAVASGMCAFDWGSDFGGSIRLPAAFCGVVGLRLPSRTFAVTGHFPFVPPELGLHGQGPLARTVAGVRTVVDAVRARLEFRRASPRDFVGVVVLGPDAFAAGEWPDAASDISLALQDAGVSVRVGATPAPRDIHHAFAALLSNHWRRFFGAFVGESALAGICPGLGRARLHPHTQRIVAELAIADRTRYRDLASTWRRVEAIRAACEALFDAGLLIATPTTTVPAPRLGHAHAKRELGVFAKLGNLLDAVALAVPFGTFASGMPRSLQLLGPPGSLDAVLALGERLAP